MRKLVYMHMASVDGFIETDASYSGPNWAVSDEELNAPPAAAVRALSVAKKTRA